MNSAIVPVRYFDGRWGHLMADGTLFERTPEQARAQMLFVYGPSKYRGWASAAKAWLLGGRK